MSNVTPHVWELKKGEEQFRCHGCGTTIQSRHEADAHKRVHGLVTSRADEFAERAAKDGYKVLWHWNGGTDEGNRIACIGLSQTRELPSRSSMHKVEHRTTFDSVLVNCENCRLKLPEDRIEREDAAARGQAVVEFLGELGIAASYENRTAPLVTLGLDGAEDVIRLLKALGDYQETPA